MQIFLSCTGFDAVSERHTSLGRSDIEVDTDANHWVFELKFQRLGKEVDPLLEDALTQMKELFAVLDKLEEIGHNMKS